MQITVKQARIGIGATQQEIAYKMGIHVTTYQKFEKNPGSMSIDQGKDFADIVGVSYSNIFFGSNSNLIREAAPGESEGGE